MNRLMQLVEYKTDVATEDEDINGGKDTQIAQTKEEEETLVRTT